LNGRRNNNFLINNEQNCLIIIQGDDLDNMLQD